MAKLALTSNCRKRIVESIFGVFYVMTEGDHPPAGNARFTFTVLLLVLDALQVLRSMGVTTYAWSSSSISILRSVDPVALFFHTVQQVIPEWIFFGISILMATGAIFNACYVMKLFRAGHVHIIWPLKVLRMLVASIVTIFFSTVLEFLLYPVRCIDMRDEFSFSSVFNGEPTACSPWNGPELAVSIPTVVVAFTFVFFSLVTTFLDFTTNPLCMHPLSQSSGRLESLWTLFKVASILMAYLAPYISATACAIILFLLAVLIFVFHATLLPFHHEAVNVMRGGIYLACVMLCLGNIILLHYPDRQSLQNWMLGSVLIAFFVGRIVVSYIVSAYNRYLGVLRGQWDEKSSSDMQGRHGKARRLSMMSEATQVGGQTWERTLHEQFFDVKWKNERRFSSGSAAYVAARILLQRRNESDSMFLMSLLTQSLKDHPNCQDLSIFHLVVLRYVHKERNQVAAQEKMSKMQSASLALDHTYVLFTLNKKSVQEGASQTLGKGSISAVNLMEFDQRMEVARKCHRDCIVQMKAFWKHVAKKRHSRGKSSTDQALKMTEELDKFTKAKDQAIQEYAWLYEKYPSSAALLSAYANFCDGVINDNKKAEQLRHEVMMMESYGQDDIITGIGEDAPPGMPMMDSDGQVTETVAPEPDTDNARGAEFRSESSGSQSESHRSQVARNMAGWNHMIMSKDAALLTTLHTQVKWALCFLLTLSLISFVVTDFILFNDVALKTVRNIEETGKFREMAATAPHLLRSQMIESQLANNVKYLEIQEQLITVTRSMQDQHFKTFEEITTKEIQDFYDDPSILVNIPRPMGWEHVTQSFRHLGTDFARRVASAASATYLEHNDPNFVLAEISTEKRDIAYTFENMIRYLMPAFNEAVGIYERQMDAFGLLCRILTGAGAGLTGLIVLAIGILVLRGRSAVLQRLHANRVTINLALELPRQVSSRFYKFFSELEVDMAILEDEENDAKQRMAGVDIELTRRGGDPRRLSIESDGGGTKNYLKSVPRLNSRGYPDDEYVMHDSATAREGLHDGMQMGGLDWRDGDNKPKLTAGNVQILMQRTSTSSPSSSLDDYMKNDGDSRPPRRSAENEDKDSELEDSQDESEDSEDQGRGERTHRRDQVRASNLDNDEESQAEEEFKDGNESEREYSEERGQTRGNSGSGTGSSGGEGGGTSEFTPRRGNPKRQSLAKTGQSNDIEDSPVKPLPKLQLSSRRSGTKQGKGSQLDEEDVPQHEEEVSAKLQARKKILRKDSQDDTKIPRLMSERSLRFSNSSQNVLDRDDTELGKAQETKLDSQQEDSQQEEKDGDNEVEDGENDESANENEGDPEKKNTDHTLDKQAITQEMQDALVLLHFKAQPWFNSFHVYVASLVILLVLCVLYSVFPARRIESIVNMAPTTNKATERISLARGCIFLARELVMADGLSRMTKAEMSGTLASFIDQYEEVDRAVRLGNPALGIGVGADHRSKLHNEVMYQLGCPWRQWNDAGRARRAGSDFEEEVGYSVEDCALPADTYPRAAGDGLFNLQSTFLDSTKAVLRKYGSPKDEYQDIYFQHRTEGEDVSQWTTVNHNIEAYFSIKDDPDLRFLEMMFDGDLYLGLRYIVDLFELETNALLDDVHKETRVLFVVYIAFLLVVFYYALFRTTLENAREEIVKAQEFVFTIPLHILEPDQADTVKGFYMRDNAEIGIDHIEA